MEFYILISPGQCDALNGYNSYLKGAKCWALCRFGGACSFFGNTDYELGLSPVDAMQYGRFSEAGLLEWMRFVIFQQRSRERSQRTSGPISDVWMVCSLWQYVSDVVTITVIVVWVVCSPRQTLMCEWYVRRDNHWRVSGVFAVTIIDVWVLCSQWQPLMCESCVRHDNHWCVSGVFTVTVIDVWVVCFRQSLMCEWCVLCDNHWCVSAWCVHRKSLMCEWCVRCDNHWGVSVVFAATVTDVWVHGALTVSHWCVSGVFPAKIMR